jgi:hypothetical protein
MSPAVTIVAAVLLIAFVLLLNIPGNVSFAVDEEILFKERNWPPVAHGWPLAYLRRTPLCDHADLDDGYCYIKAPIWDLWSHVDHFSLMALLVDVVVALGIVAGGLWLFAAWRQRRDQLWQLHLIELFGLTTAVAASCGWIIWNAREHEIEKAIATHKDQAISTYWQSGTPAWLREVVPVKEWAFLDRVVMVHSSEVSLKKLTALRHAKYVSLRNSSETQLDELASFPRLEGLRLGYFVPTGQEFSFKGAWVDHCRVPRMEKVWAVSIECEEFAVEGLEDLPALRLLDLSDSRFTHKDIPRLARLPNLRRLILREGCLSAEGLDRLRQLLPDCKVILVPPPPLTFS